MKLGVTLPQFRTDAEVTFERARQAEAAGVDGVFVFDHLWPLHQRERPALHSIGLLGALAVETQRVAIGTLVARVSILPNALLVNALVTVDRLSHGRLVAGVGAGDRFNRDENVAYGVPFPPKGERIAELAAACRMLREHGVPVWVGGTSAEVRAMAAAGADGWNGWALDVSEFADHGADVRRRRSGDDVTLTWGGPVLVGRDEAEAAAKLRDHGPRSGLVHGTVDDVARHVDAMAAAGAQWMVYAPLDAVADPGVYELLVDGIARSTVR